MSRLSRPQEQLLSAGCHGKDATRGCLGIDEFVTEAGRKYHGVPEEIGLQIKFR